MLIRTLTLLVLISMVVSDTMDQLPPQNPIIGIYTQTYKAPNETYIAASYVKYIEMSGAQVIPIFSMSTQAEIAAVLPKINGVLFPGGGMQFDINNRWTSNADFILKYAMNQTKNGNPFPVWGTCLGFQLLNYLTSGYDSKVLTAVRGQQAVVNPLNMTGASSYLFSEFPPSILQKVTKGNGLYYYNHHWAVTPQTHATNSLLKNFWNIIATSKSSYNQLFIATIEAKQYPIYGVQFHPEKNPFQWKVYADRTADGIQASQILSNKFVEVARKNKNRFSTPDDFHKISIHQHKVTYTTSSTDFVQEYIFTEKVLAQQNLIQ